MVHHWTTHLTDRKAYALCYRESWGKEKEVNLELMKPEATLDTFSFVFSLTLPNTLHDRYSYLHLNRVRLRETKRPT